MYLNKAWLRTIDITSVFVSLMGLYLRGISSHYLYERLRLNALVPNIGILPEADYMDSDEFKEMCEGVINMFG
mgnify:CR=1 FL=1